jgi:hypothetical protein
MGVSLSHLILNGILDPEKKLTLEPVPVHEPESSSSKNQPILVLKFQPMTTNLSLISKIIIFLISHKFLTWRRSLFSTDHDSLLNSILNLSQGIEEYREKEITVRDFSLDLTRLQIN